MELVGRFRARHSLTAKRILQMKYTPHRGLNTPLEGVKLKRINSSHKSYGHENSTLQEISEAMNVSKERVRKIQAKALTKLRKKLDCRGLNRMCQLI